MNNFKQVMVVFCVNLDKHVVLPSRKMTFHHLRNMLQSFRYGIKLLRIFQIQSDIGTCFIPYFFRIYHKFRTLQDS